MIYSLQIQQPRGWYADGCNEFLGSRDIEGRFDICWRVVSTAFAVLQQRLADIAERADPVSVRVKANAETAGR